MDIRVVKTRLENYIVSYANGTSDGDILLGELRELVADLNTEIEYSNQIIDSGRIATIIEELRSSYFTLIDTYDALPKTDKTLQQRTDLLDKIMTANTKICNYISYAIAKNANSTNLEIRRGIPILQGELDNYKKHNYNWCSQLRNLIEDKKAIQGDNE